MVPILPQAGKWTVHVPRAAGGSKAKPTFSGPAHPLRRAFSLPRRSTVANRAATRPQARTGMIYIQAFNGHKNCYVACVRPYGGPAHGTTAGGNRWETF